MPYDDIINHPHHVSRNHPQMSMHDRAAQFSPFAALVGYDDAIEETARSTEQHQELDEQEKIELDHKIQSLMAMISEHPRVSVKHFIPDEQKQGGKYVNTSGVVCKISTVERMIFLKDKPGIKIDDIVSIQWENPLFE